jgi:hypothetical protein
MRTTTFPILLCLMLGAAAQTPASSSSLRGGKVCVCVWVGGWVGD